MSPRPLFSALALGLALLITACSGGHDSADATNPPVTYPGGPDTSSPARGPASMAEFAANTPVASGAAEAATIEPQRTLVIDGPDGGLFNAAPVATPGSYVSDGGEYCGTVIAYGDGSRAWVRNFTGPVNVHWFGAKGDWNGSSGSDDTAAMQAAHDTGSVVYYPRGRYRFNTINMVSGGIIGDRKLTVLDSYDTSGADLITYMGDVSTVAWNELGAQFQDFILRVGNVGQKSRGAGIRIDTTDTGEMNLTSRIEGVTTRNVPTGLSTSNASFLTIQDNYFSFYSREGVAIDYPSAVWEDNGDNGIVNNWFYSNQPNAIGIRYRGGGGRIIGNKINLGRVGISISPLRSSSILIIDSNSIESQTGSNIQFVTEGDAVAPNFSQVLIHNNQLNASNAGYAVYIAPTAYQLRDLVITGNLIRYFNSNYAIAVQNTAQFVVSDNLVDCNGSGAHGIYVDAASTEGQVSDNRITRCSGTAIVNDSPSTLQ